MVFRILLLTVQFESLLIYVVAELLLKRELNLTALSMLPRILHQQLLKHVLMAAIADIVTVDPVILQEVVVGSLAIGHPSVLQLCREDVDEQEVGAKKVGGLFELWLHLVLPLLLQLLLLLLLPQPHLFHGVWVRCICMHLVIFHIEGAQVLRHLDRVLEVPIQAPIELLA